MGVDSEQDLLYFNGLDPRSGEYLTPPIAAERLAERVLGPSLVRGTRSLDDIVQELGRAAFGSAMSKESYRSLQGLLRRIQTEKASFGMAAGGNALDLKEAGWGVVFADRDAAVTGAVREALGELLEHRKAQCQGPYPAGRYAEFTYRAGDTVDEFLGGLGVGSGQVDPSKGVPYYLLLVGDPGVIPYRFQQELDVQFAVGRIHFDTLAQYASYARSVRQAETGAVKLARRATFFGPEHAGDWPTKQSANHLVAPLAEALGKEPGALRWQVERVAPADSRKERLRALLGGPQTPALLFTAGHGLGPQLGSDFTGALVCQDWPGRAFGSPSPVEVAHCLASNDVADDANPLGLVVFAFACYGAGIPVRSPFSDALWGASGESGAPQVSPIPLVSRLPQRLLGHPNGGALAFVGHIERAWPQSFMFDPGGMQELTPARSDQLRSSTTDFQSALHWLLGGATLGFAMDGFNLRFAELSTRLTGEIEAIRCENKPVKKGRMAGLWLANNDARNYVVLGDPAVRLAVAGPDEPAVARAPIERVSVPDVTLPARAVVALEATDDGAPEGDFALAAGSSASLEDVRAALRARLLELVSGSVGLTVTTPAGGADDHGAFVTDVTPDGDVTHRVSGGTGEAAAFARHVTMVEQASAHRHGEIEALAAALAALDGGAGRGG